MLLNQILLSCYFCKNPYSTRRHRSQRRHEYNFTLRATILTDMKAPLAYCSKATKKNVRYAREKTREIEACTSAQGAQKKQEREALFRLSHCKRLTSTQPKPVKNSIMHTASEIFPSIQYRESHDQKKMLEQNATTGNSIVLIRSIFFMECQISNRLRELILRCSALKNHYWKTNPLNHKIICPIMVPYWILEINFIRFIRKGCNHKNCLLVNLPSTKYWPKNCLSFKLAPIENQFQCEVS